jgi:hypothetical protein
VLGGLSFHMKKETGLVVSYAATYIAIVLIRRFALDYSWTSSFVGLFPVMYLALVVTSFFLYPFLQRRSGRARR